MNDDAALWQSYFDTRSVASRNALVEYFSWVVMDVLATLKPVGGGDAKQDAFVELIRLVEAYDPSRNDKFAMFAWPIIAWRVREADWKAKSYRCTHRKWSKRNEVSLTDSTVADDQFSSNANGDVEWHDAEDTFARVTQWMNTRDREIVRRAWMHGESGSEIAKRFGLKRCAVNLVIRKSREQVVLYWGKRFAKAG